MQRGAHLSSIIYLLAIYLLPSLDCVHGDFVEIGRSSYSDGNATIVIVPASLSSPGIFVTYSETPIPVQAFDPRNLPAKGTTTLFLAFDPKLNSFTKLMLGNGKEYGIKGGFTVKLGAGAVRLSMDSNNRNPYFSVVRELSGGEAHILGFVGTEKVLHYKGQQFVALFEANQFTKSLKAPIMEYIAEANRSITLNGKEVTLPTIGLPLETHNPCLYQGAILLQRDYLEGLKGLAPDESNAKILQKLQETDTTKSLLEGMLPLQISSKSLTFFNYTTGGFGTVNQFQDTLEGKTVCSVAPLSLAITK